MWITELVAQVENRRQREKEPSLIDQMYKTRQTTSESMDGGRWKNEIKDLGDTIEQSLNTLGRQL